MIRYIHIFEDGQAKYATDEPTQIDCDEVLDGVRTILRINGTTGTVESYWPDGDENGNWLSLDEAKLDFDHKDEPFHI